MTTIELPALVPGSFTARSLLAVWSGVGQTIVFTPEQREEHPDAIWTVLLHLRERGLFDVAVKAPIYEMVPDICGPLIDLTKVAAPKSGQSDGLWRWHLYIANTPLFRHLDVHAESTGEVSVRVDTDGTRLDIPLDVILAGQATQ